MSLTYRIGDVFDRLAEIPDGSIDLVVTSPPFLALRSYLPADHPDKAKEIGSEPTPAEFIDTLLALSAEWGRVLAPHGSICVELGDTFSGSGQSGSERDKGDYRRENRSKVSAEGLMTGQRDRSSGWPLAKSLTGIPTLYPWSLAYGRNLLTGVDSPAGQWRIRNVIVWARPNPPVGALGDKFRPATSYITVACKSAKRYFDLDSVRTTSTQDPSTYTGNGYTRGNPSGNGESNAMAGNPAGAPPLDWHADDHPEDGDWLWKLSTQPYSGKVSTVRLEPCGPDDGGERTTSADCPRHADLPGQLPKALRDARAASSSSRTRGTAGHHETEPLPGFATSDATLDREGSSPDPMTATSGHECDPAATGHSTPSRRKGRDPATTQPDTPSVRTAGSTERKSASRASSSLDPDIDESSTSPVDSSDSHGSQTSRDTDGIRGSGEIPCTCTFHRRITESTSHYATYPLALPTKLIKAMCPQRVCVTCGVPSTRIVERGQEDTGRTTNGAKERDRSESFAGTTYATRTNSTTVTLGWTDCGHDNWRTGVVLDPFGGSGTTGVAAQAVGRDCVMIDLDERNADLARERCGMFLDVEPAA